MATRKQEIPETDDTPQAWSLDDYAFSAESLNPSLQALYEEMGVNENGDAVVHVSLLDGDGKGNEASIWRGDPDSYDLEALAKKFGSGQYRVRIYVKTLEGKRVHKANKVFFWKLSPEDEQKRFAPVATEKPVDIGAAVAEAMRGILPALQTVQAPPVDQMQMMRNTIELMKVMQPQNTAPPIDQMTVMRQTIEMMNSMRPEPSDEPIARGGNAGTNDLILAMINRFGPLFAGALSQNMGQPAQAAIAVADNAVGEYVAPLQIQQNVQPQQDIQPQPESADMNAVVTMQLKAGIGWIISQCNAGGLPETYAEVVIDTIPPESLKQLLAEPDTFAWLANIEPKVREHEEWFKSLLTEVKNIVTDTPES